MTASGHGAGDLALQEFGSHLNKAIRGSDFAVRIGGDEFMVVLPECPPENVQLSYLVWPLLKSTSEGTVSPFRLPRAGRNTVHRNQPKKLFGEPTKHSISKK